MGCCRLQATIVLVFITILDLSSTPFSTDSTDHYLFKAIVSFT